MGPSSLPALAAMAATYALLEAAWLSISVPRLYTPLFSGVQGSPAAYRPAYAAIAYPLLLSAMWVLTMTPRPATRARLSVRATLFALAVYGVYNLTNLATLSRYTVAAAAADTAWGVLATNAATQAAFSLYQTA